jgi:predicted glycosyl hydrolase (DUF1957 family)
VRELLLAQSSDWAFMVTRELAAPYGEQRAREHVDAALSALAEGAQLDSRVRNVAPFASSSSLLVP